MYSMNRFLQFISLNLLFFCAFALSAQSGTCTIRGSVFDAGSGEPILFGSVYLEGTNYGTTTDINGFYSINKIPEGAYTLISTYVGYDTARFEINLNKYDVQTKNILISESATLLGEVEVSAAKKEAKTEVKTGTVTITPKQINKIPAIGGTPDLAQYLQVLPGITFTGDQGGQLYIRGGSPIQTKVLLDGITVYNPFHSIGLFSVFETEILKNVDVMTGGFSAEHGGRISAVVDVQTRDGNKKEYRGSVGTGPFMTKAVLEGPIVKLKEDGSGGSFIIAAKNSYLDRTAPIFYSYINEDGNLPYSFTDVYGKMSFNSGNGSKISLYGYGFTDNTDFEGLTQYDWKAFGGGLDARLIPGTSKTLIDIKMAYSNYTIRNEFNNTIQLDGQEDIVTTGGRASTIGGFDIGIHFNYFLNNGKAKYGVDFGGFRTLFDQDINSQIDDFEQNSTDFSAFFLYNKTFNKKFVFEPSIRFNYYGALSQATIEPRLGMKLNATDWLRIKASGGRYTQSFISTKSDRDIVNLFTGYLTAPEEAIINIDGEELRSSLQTSWHGILGAEIDITKHVSANIEGYYKHFKLVNINRNALFPSDPDYIAEKGRAYGIDFLVKYDYKRWFVWSVYSLGYITRDGLVPTLFDGYQKQTYPPHFDRRHNVNFLATYKAGKNMDWELSARWNLGSGFPFTKTQGFYEKYEPTNITDDYVETQGELAIIYDDELNSGRLPTYHRLDLSVKKIFTLGDRMKLEATASVTNVYNRKNIFYIDRVSLEKVNQLPILPSIGINFSF